MTCIFKVVSKSSKEEKILEKANYTLCIDAFDDSNENDPMCLPIRNAKSHFSGESLT